MVKELIASGTLLRAESSSLYLQPKAVCHMSSNRNFVGSVGR